MITATKRDHLWSYIGTFFNYGINILILPLILKILTTDELGLWYTFVSIQSVVMVLDFGFSTTLKRFITYAWCGAQSLEKEGIDNKGLIGSPNYSMFSDVFKACRLICLLVSSLAFVILLSFGTIYIMSITKDFTIFNKNFVPWFIFIIAVFLNIYYNYWSNALTGIGAISHNQKATVISKLVQMAIIAIGFITGLGLVALSIAYLLSGFTFRLFAKHYLLKYDNIGSKLKEYHNHTDKEKTKNVIRVVWYNAKKAGISTIASSLKRQSGTLICSSILGITVTATFGLCQQIITIIATIAQIHFVTSIPAMSGYRLANERENLKKVYSLSIMMFNLISIAGVILFIIAGLPLVSLIKADVNLPILLILLMGVTLFLENNWSLSTGFIATGNRLPHVRSLVITSILEIGLSYVLAAFTGLGVYGLLLAQLVVEGCYMSWKWPAFALKEIGLSFPGMMKMGSHELKLRVKNLMLIIFKKNAVRRF